MPEWATRSHADADQFVRKMVKRTSKVLDDVSGTGDNGPRHISNFIDIKRALTGVHVILESNAIWVTLEKGFDNPFQITDVLFGPFDFYPDEVNAINHSEGA